MAGALRGLAGRSGVFEATVNGRIRPLQTANSVVTALSTGAAVLFVTSFPDIDRRQMETIGRALVAIRPIPVRIVQSRRLRPGDPTDIALEPDCGDKANDVSAARRNGDGQFDGS